MAERKLCGWKIQILDKWIGWMIGKKAHFLIEDLELYMPSKRKKLDWTVDSFGEVAGEKIEKVLRDSWIVR